MVILKLGLPHVIVVKYRNLCYVNKNFALVLCRNLNGGVAVLKQNCDR